MKHIEIYEPNENVAQEVLYRIGEKLPGDHDGAATRRMGVAALGMAVALTGAAGYGTVKRAEHVNQIMNDYDKAHKTLTYDSPANPNDAPDTKYSQSIPEQVKPTDMPNPAETTSVQINPNK